MDDKERPHGYRGKKEEEGWTTRPNKTAEVRYEKQQVNSINKEEFSVLINMREGTNTSIHES